MNDLSLNSTHTQELIEKLTQWTKKPNLDIPLGNVLDSFETQLNDESEEFEATGQCTTNFVEAGLFVQGGSNVYQKRVDILYKKFIEFNLILSKLLSSGRENEENQAEEKLEQTQDQLPIVTPEQTNLKHDKPKQEIEEKKKKEDISVAKSNEPHPVEPPVIPPSLENTENTEETVSNQHEKLSIPGIPDEIMDKLNLTDLMRGGPIEDYIDKLDTNHPLHSLFTYMSTEITKVQEVFTYNNISLSGVNWSTLYQIEKLLNLKSKDKENVINQKNGSENTLENTLPSLEDNDAPLDTACSDNEENICASESEPSVPSVPLREVRIVLERLSESALLKYTKEKLIPVLTELKINILRLPESIVLRKHHINFKLPREFFEIEKRILRSDTKKSVNKRDRSTLEDDIVPLKKLKSFDLENFESFCYSHYVKEGIIPPKQIEPEPSRKSIDNRSEISYGYPVTPDSGRFSMSFLTDSEFEHLDDIDDPGFIRNDSGLAMSPPHASQLDSPVEGTNENRDDTLETLKTLFPTTFSDPERAEALKGLIQPTEKENTKTVAETEDYLKWKKFIEEKTSNEEDFDIHEYGTELLNSFPTHTPGEVVDFSDVVKDKTPAEISRYFVSTLQLANTYNVEIIEEKTDEVEPGNLKLKFLSDERHHEDLDTFHAPSEESFMDKLANIQTHQLMHSTPNTSRLVLEHKPISSYKKLVKKRRIEYSY